jgi:hypothetical protein
MSLVCNVSFNLGDHENMTTWQKLSYEEILWCNIPASVLDEYWVFMYRCETEHFDYLDGAWMFVTLLFDPKAMSIDIWSGRIDVALILEDFIAPIDSHNFGFIQLRAESFDELLELITIDLKAHNAIETNVDESFLTIYEEDRFLIPRKTVANETQKSKSDRQAEYIINNKDNELTTMFKIHVDLEKSKNLSLSLYEFKSELLLDKSINEMNLSYIAKGHTQLTGGQLIYLFNSIKDKFLV